MPPLCKICIRRGKLENKPDRISQAVNRAQRSLPSTIQPPSVSKVNPSALPLLTINFAGCASFDHQTLENEPHAVIHVVKENASSFDYWTVARIDGLPVHFRKVFRVRPGEHEIVVRVNETITDR